MLLTRLLLGPGAPGTRDAPPAGKAPTASYPAHIIVARPVAALLIHKVVSSIEKLGELNFTLI